MIKVKSSNKYITCYVCNSDGFVEYKKLSYSDYEDLFYDLDGKNGFHVGLFGKYCFIFRCSKNLFPKKF